MIVKVKEKGKVRYRVVTHQTHRNMGTYNTRAGAKKRLGQMKKYR